MCLCEFERFQGLLEEQLAPADSCCGLNRADEDNQLVLHSHTHTHKNCHAHTYVHGIKYTSKAIYSMQ